MANTFPQPFYQLGKSLLEKQKNTKRLEKLDIFEYKNELNNFDKCIDSAFEKGFELENTSNNVKLKKLYLKKLRECDKLYEKISYYYLKEVRKCMDEDNYKRFIELLEIDIYKSQSFKDDILSYYEKNRTGKKIDLVEKLREEAKIEKRSRERYRQEYAEYEEHIKVLKMAEAKRIRAMTTPSKRAKVMISTQKSSDGYDFIAENFNTYPVTVTLKLKKRENIETDRRVPLYFELPAKGRKKVLHVSVKDRTKPMKFQSYFSWIMGLASAIHDNVAYIIPFAKGSKIYVSQGYNGKASHKNKNAIDFAVKIGTPIYAARGGKVVSLKESNTQGKFEKSYGKYANYVIIEHDDKTLGKYYHLKKDGVVVKLGTVVKQGDLIAYSGNTGYTSGPHLHFSVSKVDERLMNRQKTIAVRFKNGGKLIRTPKKGDVITVY
jgi:murein DD-endopeptidase MepM/ murein hydrolase activator NlpD